MFRAVPVASLYLLIIQTTICASVNLKKEKMMKKITGIVVLMLLGSGSAMAAGCDAADQLTDATTPTLAGFLSGKLVLGTATSSGEDWKEIHCSSGELWKRGGTHSSGYVEVPSKVGTWSVGGTGTSSKVTYSYVSGTSSSSYSFTLHTTDSVSYSFCDAVDGAVAVTATFVSASCP